MSKEEFVELQNRIRNAVAVCEESQLSTCASELESQTVEVGELPEEHFEFLLKLLQQQDFLECEAAGYLLLALDFIWLFMSGSQKSALLVALEASYPRFTHWFSWFTISALLGEVAANEEALEVLRRLKVSTEEGPRALVPHGFEHIIYSAPEDSLGRKAALDILDMENDPSERVRNEVSISLQRLASEGYDPRSL